LPNFASVFCCYEQPWPDSDSLPYSKVFSPIDDSLYNSLSGIINNQNLSAIVESGAITISPEIVPAWYFYSVLALIVLVAFIKTFHTKYIIEYASSFVSYQLSLKVLNDAGIIRKRLGLLLNVVYLFSASLYIYTILNYFQYYPFDLSGLRLLFFSLLVLLSIKLFRLLLAAMVSFLFDRKVLFKDFIFHFFIYNKILGLALLPFVFSIPYLHGLKM
jgi:hypothetical protein